MEETTNMADITSMTSMTNTIHKATEEKEKKEAKTIESAEELSTLETIMTILIQCVYYAINIYKEKNKIIRITGGLLIAIISLTDFGDYISWILIVPFIGLLYVSIKVLVIYYYDLKKSKFEKILDKDISNTEISVNKKKSIYYLNSCVTLVEAWCSLGIIYFNHIFIFVILEHLLCILSVVHLNGIGLLLLRIRRLKSYISYFGSFVFHIEKFTELQCISEEYFVNETDTNNIMKYFINICIHNNKFFDKLLSTFIIPSTIAINVYPTEIYNWISNCYEDIKTMNYDDLFNKEFYQNYSILIKTKFVEYKIHIKQLLLKFIEYQNSFKQFLLKKFTKLQSEDNKKLE
jgi:hypothetical protein